MTQIRAVNLSKQFKTKVILNQLNFTLSNGVVGLLGRNGAGKTTLMKIIATLLRQSSGNVFINDIPITKFKQIRKMIGYLPQDFQFYNNMKVNDVLIYLGLLSEIPLATLKKRVKILLQCLDLEQYIHYKIKELSGGLKQRVGIAQALLNDPEVLIVDEPTVGLDPEERDNFRHFIGELGRRRIVIFSTHIVEDIANISDQLLIIDQGELIFQGQTTDFSSARETLEPKYLALIRGNHHEAF